MEGYPVPGTPAPFSLQLTASFAPTARKVSAGLPTCPKEADQSHQWYLA